MRHVRFVCLFGILISLPVLAQSSRAPPGNQPSELPIVQRVQNLSQMTHGVRFAQRRSAGFKASGPRRRVLKAPGTGLNFANVVDYSSGGRGAYSVAVADVNGDGKPDIVVANECGINDCTDGDVAVLLGNGDGTFRTAVSYDSGGYQTRSVAVADVNADGKPDLLVTSCCGSQGIVGVLLGNGDGTFQAVVTYYSGGADPAALVVVDLNGDGKPDLVVANAGDNTVGVLLGNGDGTFQTAVSYNSGGTDTNSVAVADVNGDGEPDLLAVNVCSNWPDCKGSVGVLLGNGDGTFQAAVAYDSGGWGALSAAVADVNGDGRPDLLVANCSRDNDCNGQDGVVGVLLGNGDGTFQAPVAYDSGGYDTNSVAVADVDGDGKLDLICKNDGAVGTVGVLLGKGDGTFQTAVTFNSDSQGGIGSAALSLVVVDVNGDGKPDLLAAGLGETVGVLINTSNTKSGVTFSPTSLMFSTQLVFTTSPPQPVTLTSSGPGVLTISRISMTGPFLQTNNCPKSLRPGVYCTINVKFHPTTKGVLNGSVNVKDNAPGSPQKVPLTGTGTFVQLTPAKLNFGSQPVGTRSLAKRITLTNKGSSAVNISSIAITGTDSGDFAETNNCGSQVASGASCFIKVTFKPLAKGKRKADVSVTDDGGGSPQTVPLTGTGT